jgi:hypothetical protein
MIDRDEAHRIAAREIVARGLGTGVRSLYAFDEIPGRRSSLYGVALGASWIAYADGPITGPRPSDIVVISRATGEVIYSGSAHDEG